MSKFAPILVFVFKRQFHISNLLNSLAQCDEAKFSELIIYSDGPKNPSDNLENEAIQNVRDICSNENRFKSVRLVKSEKNLGLANSIINGVTNVIEEYGSVIVLEDDLIVSPFFLKYMNDALVEFKNDERVGQIGACNFFANGEKFPGVFFIPIPDCLGWATWKENWKKFITDPDLIFKQLEMDKKLSDRFNGYGSYDFSGLLKSKTLNKVDSWAILWHATCVLNNWLTLYPNPSMTNHIESTEATHANVNIIPPLASFPIDLKNIPVKEVKSVIRAMKLGYSGNGDYFGKALDKNLWAKLKRFLKK